MTVTLIYRDRVTTEVTNVLDKIEAPILLGALLTIMTIQKHHSTREEEDNLHILCVKLFKNII